MTRTTLASCLAALAVSGALSATAIATDAGPARAATTTYVHGVINERESPLRVRPSIIRVQGSGAISYSRLRWRNWGTSRAQAKGRQCSGRTGGCQTASIRLSDLSVRSRGASARATGCAPDAGAVATSGASSASLTATDGGAAKTSRA